MLFSYVLLIYNVIVFKNNCLDNGEDNNDSELEMLRKNETVPLIDLMGDVKPKHLWIRVCENFNTIIIRRPLSYLCTFMIYLSH